MAGDIESFRKALESKKLPVLTLDNKWYRLFSHCEPNSDIIKYEKQLNDLLRRQGKLTTEAKDIKKIKSKLMDEIVVAMNADDGTDDAKKIEDNKRLIADCNVKLEAYQDELLDLPSEIDKVNLELMLRTMEMCNIEFKENNKEIAEITEWLNEVRKELKKKAVKKQEMITANQNLYSYMHTIFGAEVIELFDMNYS